MINDLARITTISVLTLKKLFNNLSMCICHRVLENYLDKKIDTVVDIGIGKLAISMESDCIFYKFITHYNSFEPALYLFEVFYSASKQKLIRLC